MKPPASYIRFSLPVIIAMIYVGLSEWGFFYLIFPVLLAGNLFNRFWGEFTEQEIKQELNQFYGCQKVRFLKIFHAFCLAGLLVWAAFFVNSNHFSTGELIFFSFTTGCLSGCFAVTLAHDLLHGRFWLEKLSSSFLLLFAGIPHMAADHLFGHHRLIGLESDTNTSKLNQNFYTYFARLSIDRIYQSFIKLYNLPTYLKKKIFRYNLTMLAAWIALIALLALLPDKPGAVMAFYFIQSMTAYFLYELINYIQHYGLSRDSENHEIKLAHSWNCYFKYTNYILYMLPLHSLHHLSSAQRKMQVNHLKDGPRMPYLYFVMVFMALIPPLWFSRMNKMVSELSK